MSKKKNQSLNFILLILLCITIMVIVVLLIFLIRDNNSSSNPEQINQGTNILTGDYEESVETFGIKTPYCTVQYPKEWKQYLEYNESTENGVFKQTYYCVLAGNKIEMFSIFFGEDYHGTQIGFLSVEGNVVKFSVDSTEYALDYTLSDEEKNIYDGMCYGINHIIDSVVNLKNFSY